MQFGANEVYWIDLWYKVFLRVSRVWKIILYPGPLISRLYNRIDWNNRNRYWHPISNVKAFVKRTRDIFIQNHFQWLYHVPWYFSFQFILNCIKNVNFTQPYFPGFDGFDKNCQSSKCFSRSFLWLSSATNTSIYVLQPYNGLF